MRGSAKSVQWVVNNFTYEFRSSCLEEPGVDHNIPNGDAIRREPTALHVKSLPIRYRQKELPLCVLYSMLSALQLYGDSVAPPILLTLKNQMEKAGSVDVYYGGVEGTRSDSRRRDSRRR